MASAYADVKACVLPGLHGVVVQCERAADVDEVAAMLTEREREEGIPRAQVEVMLLLGSAKGIWNVREMLHASGRIACTAIDEVALCESLSIEPSDEFDALAFSRGRVIVETLAAGRLPLGIGHPLGASPRTVDVDELRMVLDRARNSGLKGALCRFASWVEACNCAFTPSDEQVAYSREVRKAFAEGL